MNRKFEEFLNSLKHKKVAVIGVGISNEPLLRILASHEVQVEAFDKISKDSDRAKFLKKSFEQLNYSINWNLGEDYLEHLSGFDLIIRTPGMMPYEEHLLHEKAKGAIITSEMDLFIQFCPAKIYGITGSDGKSTTTSMVYAMLQEQGYDVYLGGNIGNPLLEQLTRINEDAKVVLELSSFQLIDLTKSPNVSVLTNVTPNHLNVHQSLEEYIEAKRQIYKHQSIADTVVINGLSEEFAKDWEIIKSNIIWFNQRYANCKHKSFQTSQHQLGYYERNQNLFIPICDEKDLHVFGSFNIQNALAAMAAVSEDVDVEHMKKAIQSFKGLEHRIEFIREINGFKFYNSSIDSSPERSKHSISAFIERQIPVTLIMGGQDKNCDYSDLGKYICAATSNVILFGENAMLIEKQIEEEAHLVGKSKKEMNIIHCNNYEQAVHKAMLISHEGDAILLTPAGTSFDHFSNFMERGKVFKQIVEEL